MIKNIATLRAELNSLLDTKATLYGEDTELDVTEQEDVSRDVDEINETWNPNLPPRPPKP